MVLGANRRAARINPLIEGGAAGNPASRRLPIGNLLNRAWGAARWFLPLLQPIAELLQRCEPNPARLAADFHTAFNVLLALVFIGAARRRRRAGLTRVAARPAETRGSVARRLSRSKRRSRRAAVALVYAAREVLRMGDFVEAMLRKSMTALLTNDRKLVAEISRMDDAVDSLNEAVKLYVTRMTRDSMDDRDGYRAMEIVSFSINLEHVGSDRLLQLPCGRSHLRKLQRGSFMNARSATNRPRVGVA